jgi:hypothetical protein
VLVVVLYFMKRFDITKHDFVIFAIMMRRQLVETLMWGQFYPSVGYYTAQAGRSLEESRRIE